MSRDSASIRAALSSHEAVWLTGFIRGILDDLDALRREMNLITGIRFLFAASVGLTVHNNLSRERLMSPEIWDGRELTPFQRWLIRRVIGSEQKNSSLNLNSAFYSFLYRHAKEQAKKAENSANVHFLCMRDAAARLASKPPQLSQTTDETQQPEMEAELPQTTTNEKAHQMR